MSFLTGLALKRRSVTILVIILLLVGGVSTFRSLERELFPEIEFPNISIATVYPSANPDAVVRDVTEPIEEAIEGMDGLKDLQSVSSENLSLVLATFEFGEDLEEAERTIESNLNGLDFPAAVEDPYVYRITNDTIPVLNLSVTGDRDIPSLQRILDELIIPRIEGVDGVFNADIIGEVEEQVVVTVDTDKVEDLGLSLVQVSNALSQNNISFPAGDIDSRGASFPVRTTHEFGSLNEIRNLTIGFENASMPAGTPPGVRPGGRRGDRAILLSDVAEVTLSTGEATGISRTNGKPSLSIAITKEPDANTIDVTSEVREVLNNVEGLPPDVEIIVLTDDGPEVQAQLDTVLREGLIGFVFAVLVVAAFLINLRPSLLKGVALSLRPTLIIAISIPLSILTGVLLMGLANLTLNFMSLAGLAIAVGRVVDDSIVVLENMYRHIQRGKDGPTAAVDATKEVGAAIVSSTLTTVAVFVPLAFIPGLVGSFFFPFAMSVSFALVASTLVAMTAVPVLGAVLLRRGDFPETEGFGGDDGNGETRMQRVYAPILAWSLRHKLATLLIAAATTVASLGLTLVIPITVFPAGSPQFMNIDVELPTGTPVGRTFAEVIKVEGVLKRYQEQGLVDGYQVAVGSEASEFGPAKVTAGFHRAGFFVRLADEAPEDIAQTIRDDLPGNGETTITVRAFGHGPPTDDLVVNVTGNNFTAVSAVAKQLEADLGDIDGIVNVSSDVTEAKNEVVIHVDPKAAAEYGLNAALVGQQVNQFIVGQAVTEVDLEGVTMDVVVKGQPEDVDDIEKLRNLTIQGPLGLVKLGSISNVAIERGPVSISRFDSERSASITGEIISEDTQAIGEQVQARIDALDLPPGVEVRTGGIFEQLAEGFADVFQAMAIGVILVYLVMVASLGSLRNPLIIVMSLPLAVVGALVALAVTDRTLSLAALMGFLLLIGVVVTNAIVLITFVEQLRERGLGVYDALVQGSLVRLRPILMTAFTTTIALLPLAISSGNESGIISAELATVVVGGMVSSTVLTLLVVPVLYTVLHVSLPGAFDSVKATLGGIRVPSAGPRKSVLASAGAGDPGPHSVV